MSWHRLCELSELPETGGCGREFVVEGSVVAVFRAADDQLHVMDGMCAHQGGPLSQGRLDHHCLTCPWHGWQYDVTTGHNLLTHKKMLDVYPLEIRGDHVWIEFPA